MKNLLSFISLLILLHTTTGAEEVLPDAVLDVDGHALLRGWNYFVEPRTIPGGGRGIVPYAIPNKTCSYGVSQLQYGEGLPLSLRLVNSTILGGAIRELTDLDISFSISVGCGPSDSWRKGEYDKATQQYFVMIGGVRGNPGIGTLPNAFQIRKVADDYYKFVFCPATCASCYRKCDDVGIFYDDGVRRLAVNGGTPFLIRFRKYAHAPELARY